MTEKRATAAEKEAAKDGPQAKTGAEPKLTPHEATDAPAAHAPSSPGQASAAEMEGARPAALGGGDTLPPEQVNEADDNPIERGTREMSQRGATAGEIAAWREEQFAKLGDKK